MTGVGMTALAGTASAQNSPASAALDTSLRGALERRDVPGVVALITDRERVLYQSAFGVADVATGRTLTIDALFRIASMTKPVTSLALMQLVERAPALTSTITHCAREGADGQAVVCPFLTGPSPPNAAPPQQHPAPPLT